MSGERGKERTLETPSARPLPSAARSERSLAAAERTRLCEQALRFYMRGAVHRLNNALAVVSSHAQLLAAGMHEASPRRDARALENAAARSRRVLDVVDLLAARGASTAGVPVVPLNDPVCIGSLVRSIGDGLLCERAGQHFPVEVEAVPRSYAAVCPSTLASVLVLAVAHLLEEAPLPLTGTIVLAVEKAARVTVRFRIGSGQLPFRPEMRPVDGAIVRMAERAGIAIAAGGNPPALTIQCPRAEALG